MHLWLQRPYCQLLFFWWVLFLVTVPMPGEKPLLKKICFVVKIYSRGKDWLSLAMLCFKLLLHAQLFRGIWQQIQLYAWGCLSHIYFGLFGMDFGNCEKAEARVQETVVVGGDTEIENLQLVRLIVTKIWGTILR